MYKADLPEFIMTSAATPVWYCPSRPADTTSRLRDRILRCAKWLRAAIPTIWEGTQRRRQWRASTLLTEIRFAATLLVDAALPASQRFLEAAAIQGGCMLRDAGPSARGWQKREGEDRRHSSNAVVGSLQVNLGRFSRHRGAILD
jgi:hypothetical protein